MYTSLQMYSSSIPCRLHTLHPGAGHEAPLGLGEAAGRRAGVRAVEEVPETQETGHRASVPGKVAIGLHSNLKRTNIVLRVLRRLKSEDIV